MATTQDAVSEALKSAANEIARRCGHGKLTRKALPRGGVRVEIRLADNADSAQHRAIAEAAVYARLSAIGVPSQIACF